MLAKHLLFIAVLLPQFCLLALIAYAGVGLPLSALGLYRGGFSYSNIDLLFYCGIPLALTAVIGLCGLREWARWLYGVMVVPWAVLLMFYVRQLESRSGTGTEEVYLAFILATLAFCFVPGLRLFGQTYRGFPMPPNLRTHRYLPDRII